MPHIEARLVEQHAPMVRRQALQMIARLPSSVELDDLIQAGMMGLLDAVRRYQVMAEAQFETYAITRIRGAMLDELRSQDWLPRSVRTKARQVENALTQLRQALQREPTEVEIAAHLELDILDYQQLLEEASGVQILHYEDLARREEGEGGDALEFLGNKSTEEGDALSLNPFEQLVSHELRQNLIDAIDALPEREKLLLSLQFEQDLNQKEIAAVLEVTEGRVSQLRSQAVARIRSYLQRQNMGERPDILSGQFLL